MSVETSVIFSMRGAFRRERPDLGMPMRGSVGNGYCPSKSLMKHSSTLYLGLSRFVSTSGISRGPVRVDKAVAVRAAMLPGP